MRQYADHDGVVVEPVATQTGGAATNNRRELESVLGGDAYVVDLRIRQPLVIVNQQPGWQLVGKRVLDIVGASLALVVLSSVFLVTAILIAVTSPGPVFFRQRRAGRFGTAFSFLKFRSMYVDAEARREELEALNQHTSGPIFKIKNDPRITPVGRVIRKLSLDELPQLFHVLSGKMSLVGPRPPILSEVDTYGLREHRRLLVKPGLTCIWQVSGRSELDFETWMDLDMEYIENWSLWLDVKLLARTIPAVLSCRGAY